MNFKKWLEKEMILYKSLKNDPKYGLSPDGTRYFNILNKINEICENNIEEFIRENIKNNDNKTNKKHYKYIYKNFLIYEGYIDV